ncbi:hypothetical protein ANN_10538, partial [Periplaneta americana]
TTSRIDLIRLIPPENDDFSDCSSSVVVSAISKERMRNTAIVFAEEKNSGLILRCDVIVDVISSLNLVTTTRELFMEEAPEAFEVRAYDDQGNEFTTLEGVEFQWSLSNWNAHQESSSSGPCNVLRFITFRDSPYETPPTVQAFDEVGKHGHIVLLEGIKTGSAKVSVRLPYSEYQDVSAIEVQLMIVANLIIDPADIYLLKGDSVRYRVLQVHHGRLEEISLPSQQYFLAIDDTTIASINEKTAVVSGLKIGKTKVLLHDRNVDEKEAGIRVPAATLTVNDPCYLTLALLPHRNWILMIEEHYEIVVEAYDSDDHKFFIGDGVQVLVSIPEEYFHVHSSTVNNTHHFGWPVQVGTSQVNATLEGVKDSSGVLQPSPRISAIADMLIYNRITIHPSEVALPWDPIIQPNCAKSMGKRMVRCCCRQFSAGCQNVHDEERCGRPTIIADDLVEQRLCVKFCFLLGKTAAETVGLLQQAFNDDALRKSQVYEWFSHFKSGNMSTEDMPRPGHPSTGRNDENIAKIKHAIDEDRRKTIDEVSEQTNLIVTGDGSWCYGYDPKSKQASSQWKTPNSPRPKKARQVRFNVKTMLICVFDVNGIVHKEYEVGLNASGGDGSFIWSSHNTSVAVVTQTGLVKTHARGQTEISAAMARNHHNREVANVYILPASHLEIVEYVLEAEIGTPIFLHVAVFADRPDSILSTRSRIPFSHCDDLPLVIKIWSDHFVNSSLKIAPVGISCTTVALIGQSVGNAKVTVSYTFQEHTIADSALIGAYRPLTIVHPESRETVLAVGTSREVLFSGGPRPWIGRASEHVHQIILEGDEKIVEVTELVDRTEENSDNYLYRVLCKELGEVHVTLQITNVPSVGHCKKSLSEASLKVHCARPRYVTMTSEQPDTASCPLNLNSGKLVVQNYKELELLVVVKDEHGRVFDNVTSLYFDWKLSHSTLGTLVEKGSVISKAIQEEEIILPNKNYQVLKPTARTGVLDVSVTVVAYHSEKLEKMGIFHEDPPFGITNERGYVVTPEILASLSLILVNDTVITPNQTTVFNHARNKVNLQVNQGSGYYEFILSSEEIADINYVESTKVLEVIPKIDGLLKIALVDLCLVSKPAIAEVQVLGVGSIKVEVPERVERGQCVSAIVRLYDTMDNLLPVPSAEFLDLRPKPDSGIIGIKMQQDKKSSLPLGEIRYIVTGLELGETGLKFTSGRGQREIHSQRLFIQVFPPLRLFPRNVTLIVGSVCQISSRGGPQPDANIEYSISAADIVTISTSGVVTGSKLGASVVTAKAVGVSKMTGNKVVYSQDSIEVHVIQLQGINIHAPLSRLKTGTTMPIWAQGIPDVLSPIVIGTVVPSLRFTWSVSTREVGRVHHVFEEFGLTIAAEDMVSMRFTAMSPGRTILRMDVYVPLSLGGRLDEPSYHDSIEIEVFEELLLIRPPYPLNQQSPMLLLAPNSEVQLRTNRDGLAKMTYSLGGKLLPIGQGSDNETVSKALTDPDHLLTVEPGGLVKSHNRLGRSVIMVIAKEDFGIRQILSISVEVSPIM